MIKEASESKIVQEALGLVFVFASILLFLALVSFDPWDLSVYRSPAQEPVVNFIGPFGAAIAGALFFFLGYAAYALPLIIVGMAIRLVWGARIEFAWAAVLKLALGTTLLVMLACFLELPFFSPWLDRPNFNGWAGGYLGFHLIDLYAAKYIGTAGALICILLLGSISFIFLYDISPRRVMDWVINVVRDWLEERRRRKMEQADPIERMALEGTEMAKRVAKEEKELLKRLAKQGVPNTFPTQLPDPGPLPSAKANLTIIDTTRTPFEEPVKEVEPAKTEPMREIDLGLAGGSAVEENAGKKGRGKKESAEKVKGGELENEPHQDATLPAVVDYELPSISLLDAGDRGAGGGMSHDELEENRRIIVETLRHFRIDVEAGQITRGATITVYEVKPAPGVRVERIANLSKNLARALKAEKINILAPIPGKDTVGIEVGNSRKVMIRLRELFETDGWLKSKAKIPIAISKDVYGRAIVGDLAEMPHLLIAGTTGSGKSVSINCLLLSLLYKFRPNELRLILVDPKVVELQTYNKLPHLAVPVVTETRKVLASLKWAVDEMEQRYRYMARAGVRNIVGFNGRTPEPPPPETDGGDGDAESGPDLFGKMEMEPLPEFLPYVVIIIDELADLMQTAPAEVELAIARLSAKARAAGIHLVLATQTPRANVITGVIKANVPSRIAFQVNSGLDSRVILDENGAENLLGKGDSLYLPPGSAKLVRGQGAFVSDEEVARVVEYIVRQAEPKFEESIQAKLDSSEPEEEELSEKEQENYENALEILRQERDGGNDKASTSMLQRRLRIGYNTAANLIDRLGKNGIIKKTEDGKSWEITRDAF
jgi:S-DNA-T family DNA segregation ATPase FtsK/SpoIIIE